MADLPHIPEGLGEIAPLYDALLCDVWGVVHNGRQAFDAATQALARFRQRGGIVLLLTNAPRPGSEIPAQLESLGVRRDCWDAIVTSGDATRALLRASAPGPAFKLGPPKDDRLYEGTGMAFAPLEEARLISCTGLFDDRHETPDDYRDMLQEAARRGLPMISANPDLVVRYGDRLIYCGGALADLYQQLGGTVISGGKPHAPIYALSLQTLENLHGAPVPRQRILAIGDGLNTDIAGAAAQGLDSLFISGGIHGARQGSADDAQHVHRLLSEHNTRARYALPGLRW